MICRNCGKLIEDNALFCPACGSKIEDISATGVPAAAVPATGDPANAVPATAVPANAAEQVSSTAPGLDESFRKLHETAAGTSEPKEKEFFGVGAFVLCLVVIALLAGAAGTFACLYFSAIGVI